MRRSIRWLAPALMTASGFAGLGYQIVWTQQSAVWLGHEAAAVLAVVGAFFGGLSLGAFVLARRIESSARPGRWYAGCEALIGAWSLLLAVLLQPVGGWLLAVIGAEPPGVLHWLAAFAGTFLLLLPATVAMGATLPALERALSSPGRPDASVALLYAANTCGALLGVLATAFMLVPTFGLTLTALLCAALNLACAGVSLRVFTAAPLQRGRDGPPAASRNALGLRRVLLLTGLLGIGYEVLVVRVLSQVAENTVYTFALLLAAYLVGTTAGAAAYPTLRRRWAEHALQDSLLLALAAACFVGTLSMSAAAAAKSWLSSLLPTSVAMALAAEAALAAAAFLVPTFFMGALFTHLATRARDARFGFAHAVGFNTLGAAIAPALFGVLVVPHVGTKLGLLMIPLAYVASLSRRRWRSGAIAAAAGVVLALWLPSLAFVDVPPGGRLVSRAEGVLATVSVVEDARGVARLHINNRQQEGSTATFYVDGRQGLIPLLLHANPRSALFLGLGTGATAGAAAAEPHLTVDVVELLPEVVDASAYFTERTTAAATREGPRILTADARRYVRATERRYDVIVSDNFHPARSGSAALYTVEHFSAVHDRLTPDGLFCQWLPLHQLDLPTLRSIVRSFLAAFPQGTALLASYSLDTPVIGLVAAAGDGRIRVDDLRARLATVHRQGRSLEDYGLDGELAVLGSFVAGPRALARFAGDAPLNTDDRPIVAYRAPRAAYAPQAAPRDRLLELLATVAVTPEEILTQPRDTTFEPRLTAYWMARDAFIAAGRDVVPTSDATSMLEQVRGPLLEVLRISPEFRPAYDPLLAMAIDVARSDPSAARALLEKLHDLASARPDAAEALRALDPARR